MISLGLYTCLWNCGMFAFDLGFGDTGTSLVACRVSVLK